MGSREPPPQLPDVVAHGRPPNGLACALCHLTTGGGHPESAGISGLPARYFIRQLREVKRGAPQGAPAVGMIPIAKGLNEEDFKAAAAYYQAIKYPVWYKVIESDTVPKSYLG